MKSALPWVIIVVLLGGVYFLYSANKEKEADLAKQAIELQDMDKLRADSEELKKLSGQNGVGRLRKDNEDNLRFSPRRPTASATRTNNLPRNSVPPKPKVRKPSRRRKNWHRQPGVARSE